MVDYCTESDIETYLGITIDSGTTPTSSDVATIITDVSRTIDNYARRTLSGVTSGEVEYFDVRRGLDTIVLSKRPVNTVTSIEKIGTDGQPEVALDQGRARDGSDDYWLQDAEAGIIRFHSTWETEIRDYLKVTYSYGESSIPHTARTAAILMTCVRVVRTMMVDENCSERVRQVYSETLKALKPEAEAALKEITMDRNVGVGVLG